MKKIITLILTAAILISTSVIGADKLPYIIKYKTGMKSAVLKNLSKNNNKARLMIDAGKLIAVNLTESALKGLTRNPAIEYIEADPQFELYAQVSPYAVSLMQADQLSDMQASNIKVCVIDTGVQTSHEDLDDSRITGTSTSGSGLLWNEPDHSHGTYMAGAVLAQNNSVGVHGVLPNGFISLHSFRLDFSFNLGSQVVEGIYDCIANSANIITISAGTGTKSRALATAVADAAQNNIMIMAAAGNDASDKTKHYPSSYDEVVSVGAVDRFEQLALYSNTASNIEFVAAGDAVLGLNLMGQGTQANLTIAGNSSYETIAIFNGVNTTALGNLVDCGDINSNCLNANGNICMIQAIKTKQNSESNGTFDISDQVLACEANGGVGAIFYNDASEVQYQAFVDPTLVSIPVVVISDTEMAIAFQNIGSPTSIDVFSSNYFRTFGTSISSPFVAGAAALVWSYHPICTGEDIRQALAITAKDLGVVGKDPDYGNGLPQVLDAKLYLDANPCGGTSNLAPTASYTSQCTLLSCSFDAGNSSDSDGNIVSYDWDFGDGNTSTGITTNHSYANDGSYTVSLTVTDDMGAADSNSSIVSVSNNSIQLSLNGYKVKGKQYTDLTWNGINSNDVKIYRNGSVLTTVANNGLYTDFVGQRGSFDYQVCESDDSICSGVMAVTF